MSRDALLSLFYTGEPRHRGQMPKTSKLDWKQAPEVQISSLCSSYKTSPCDPPPHTGKPGKARWMGIIAFYVRIQQLFQPRLKGMSQEFVYVGRGFLSHCCMYG